MKEGFWGNYESGEFFKIDEHERWIRRENNATRLGVPGNVIEQFPEFKMVHDRDRFLPFLFAHAPIMRLRGHGSSITLEFNAEEWTKPLALVEKWGRLNAGPFLLLNMMNFKRMQNRQILWKDFNGISD